MANDRDYHEHQPHFDGKYEGPISDTNARGSNQMGVRADLDPKAPTKTNNTLPFEPEYDSEMKKFQKYTDGKAK